MILPPSLSPRVVFPWRSYWIPGAYAPPLSEKRNSFLRPLKKKGFPKKIVTKVGVYDLGKSTALESNKSHRLNLDIRQHVAAVGRRVSTLCKGEEGLRQQLALYHVYDNFCLPHASLRQPVSQPVPTNGTGSATMWQPHTPAMAAGLTDRV